MRKDFLVTDPRPKTFLPGAALVWRRQRVLWLIFAVNLLLAHFFTHPARERLGGILNHSLASSELVHGFNLSAFASLAANPEAPLTGLSSSYLFSALLFTIFMWFATGGILASYYSGQRLRAGDFFEACGHHFWRFVRLTIYLLIVLIPVVILCVIAGRIYQRIDAQSISPMPAVHFFEAAAAAILLLLITIRTWFDMAQVIAVADDEYRMHRVLRRAAVVLSHNFGSLLWLYFRLSLIAWIVFWLGLHIWMDHLRPESTVAVLLLSQFLIIFWLACRLWQRASECIWFRDHQRAVAAAVPAYEPPPVAPAITPPLEPEGPLPAPSA